MHASGISKGVAKACHAARGQRSPHITKQPLQIFWIRGACSVMRHLMLSCALLARASDAAVAAVRTRVRWGHLAVAAFAVAVAAFAVAALRLPSLSRWTPSLCQSLDALLRRLPPKLRCRAPRTTAGRVPAVPRHAECAMRSRTRLGPCALAGASCFLAEKSGCVLSTHYTLSRPN